MTRNLFAAVAATAMLAGCSTMGMDPMVAPAAMDMTPEQRTPYVQMAASSDMYEIQSSQLALGRAQNPAIRSFAQMMITHHTQTTQQLTAAAQASGSMMPPAMMPMHRDLVARLQGASGAAFDRMYMEQQVMAHEMALALHSNYAQAGDTPALRVVAAAATPIVQQHLTQARQLR